MANTFFANHMPFHVSTINDHRRLTPVATPPEKGKMLERHVHYLITEHLSSNDPLANTQWGFQSGKSTATALLTTTYDWQGSLLCVFQYKESVRLHTT